MTALPVVAPGQGDCWNKIGVRGDRTCPELAKVVHCHNCPVHPAAGRHFLDAPSPTGYLEEWTQRLAAPEEESATDLHSVLVFRLAEEWLALPVRVLVEVTPPYPVHRIPHRAGLLAGLVNIRGELHLCVHLARLLGSGGREAPPLSPSPLVGEGRGGGGGNHSPPPHPSPIKGEGDRGADAPRSPGTGRMLVVRREGECWVFPADEVDQVHRFPAAALGPVPATVGRSGAHLTRGVFGWQGRSIGYLDDARLFHALRTKLR